jgi:hypothetical protein
MKRFMFLCSMLSLTGCLDPLTMMPGKLSQLVPPQTATVYRAESPDACYQRAYRDLVGRPAQVTGSDATVRHLSALEKGLIVYNVNVTADQRGCAIHVHAALLPSKLTTGDFYEPQEYIQRLQQ